MGSYFTDKWNALMALPAAIAEAPVFFAILFLIFGPLIWWKWRATGKGIERATQDPSHGLRVDADTKTQIHETGIGTQDVLEMRPAKTPFMIWFGLLFFGGGAVFFAMVVLVDEPTSKDWQVFAIMMLFAVGSMVFIEANQTRIIVSPDTIERRRVLHRRQRIAFSSITNVSLARKTLVGGVVVTDANGQKMRIAARFSGYLTALDRLAKHDPKLSLMVKLHKAQARA